MVPTPFRSRSIARNHELVLAAIADPGNSLAGCVQSNAPRQPHPARRRVEQCPAGGGLDDLDRRSTNAIVRNRPRGIWSRGIARIMRERQARAVRTRSCHHLTSTVNEIGRRWEPTRFGLLQVPVLDGARAEGTQPGVFEEGNSPDPPAMPEQLPAGVAAIYVDQGN